MAEYQAVEESINIVRVKRAGHDAVLAARFDNQLGRSVRAIVGLLLESNGRWQETGGFALGAPSSHKVEQAWRSGGWTHPSSCTVRGFWVGHPEAVSLKLTDGSGNAHEDDIEHGVSMLMWNGNFALEEARVTLLDATGGVVAEGPISPAPALANPGMLST